MNKFLIFSAIFTFFVSVFLTKPVHALYSTGGPGAGPSSSTFDTYGQALKEPALNLEQFNLFNLDYTGFGLTKLLVGVPAQWSGGGAVQAPSQNYGAFGILSSVMSGMYSTKPISGVQYLADLGKNFGIGKPAYAQEGFAILKPVQELWTITRNLSYLAFVLIFVVVGFMIMMRARIDPRTVATIQNAIPGIIIALILVTVSYALAGLVLDFTQVLIALIVGALQPVLNINDAAFQEIAHRNIFSLMYSLMQPGATDATNIVSLIIQSIPGSIFDALGGVASSGLGQSIIGLIFSFLIVFTAFRVFIMLLTSLVTIVLMTIGAPFMFLAAAIPGRGGAVVGWFKSIGGAALVFPVTFLMLAIAAVFVGAQGTPWNLRPGQGIGGFSINLIPFGQYAPLDKDGHPIGPTIPIAQMIGLGILLLTPKVGDMIKEAFQQKTPQWAGEPLAALKRIPIVGGFLG